LGKLNEIVCVSAHRNKLLFVCLAAGMFLAGSGVWAAGSPPVGERAGGSPGDLNDEHLAWIIWLDGEIEINKPVDGVSPGEALEELKQAWTDRFGMHAPDSLSDLGSPLEAVFRMQIDRVASVLGRGGDPKASPADDIAKRLGRARRAIGHLSHLVPLVSAARDSSSSALLVISSIGCECELERCDNMLSLYESVSGETPIGPMAAVDLMEVPALEEVLGPMAIPYWVLFDQRGNPGTIVAGDSDVDDVRSAVLEWLGAFPDDED
jgi:hypothetical protein